MNRSEFITTYDKKTEITMFNLYKTICYVFQLDDDNDWPVHWREVTRMLRSFNYVPSNESD